MHVQCYALPIIDSARYRLCWLSSLPSSLTPLVMIDRQYVAARPRHCAEFVLQFIRSWGGGCTRVEDKDINIIDTNLLVYFFSFKIPPQCKSGSALLHPGPPTFHIESILR